MNWLKRYELSSKELIEILVELGVPIKNHMSTLDPETIILVEAELHPQETIPSDEQEQEEINVESKSEEKDQNQETENAVIVSEDKEDRLKVSDDIKEDEVEPIPEFDTPEESKLQSSRRCNCGNIGITA